jgi:hypothetical protein
MPTNRGRILEDDSGITFGVPYIDSAGQKGLLTFEVVLAGQEGEKGEFVNIKLETRGPSLIPIRVFAGQKGEFTSDKITWMIWPREYQKEALEALQAKPGVTNDTPKEGKENPEEGDG